MTTLLSPRRRVGSLWGSGGWQGLEPGIRGHRHGPQQQGDPQHLKHPTGLLTQAPLGQGGEAQPGPPARDIFSWILTVRKHPCAGVGAQHPASPCVPREHDSLPVAGRHLRIAGPGSGRWGSPSPRRWGCRRRAPARSPLARPRSQGLGRSSRGSAPARALPPP